MTAVSTASSSRWFDTPRRRIAILASFHLVAASLLLMSGWSTPFLLDGESPLINFLTPIVLGLVIAYTIAVAAASALVLCGVVALVQRPGA